MSKGDLKVEDKFWFKPILVMRGLILVLLILFFLDHYSGCYNGACVFSNGEMREIFICNSIMEYTNMTLHDCLGYYHPVTNFKLDFFGQFATVNITSSSGWLG